MDGSLQLELSNYRDTQTLIAFRPEAARAKGLAPPEDPTQHTKLKDPNEQLHFSFPDLQGQIVSDRDPRFRGKVVLVNITGSWCPNCHDEAPFLEALYEKYHDQGLEIVALDFEQARVKAAADSLFLARRDIAAGHNINLQFGVRCGHVGSW